MSKPPTRPPRKPTKVEDEEDISHRTVELFLNDRSLISEDGLFRALSKFGTIMDISLRSKGAAKDTVLFSSSQEAIKSAASFHETVLGEGAQARYLPDLEKEQLAVQNISAVGANQTELFDLEDVSNFDRTAMSATMNESVDSAANDVDKMEDDAAVNENKGGNINTSVGSSLEIPKPSSSPGGAWKIAEKANSPPQKPPRQMKGESSNKSNTASPTAADSPTAYISSDGMNETPSRFDATADASISKYDDYLGDSVSEAKEATPMKNENSAIRGVAESPHPAQPVTASVESTSSSQERQRIGLFTNIYETTSASASSASPGTSSSPPPKPSSPPKPRTTNSNSSSDGEDIMELKSRVRVLEAEARVRAKERIEFDLEMHKMEVGWSTELTAVSIRNKNLEEQNRFLKDEQRKSNVEMSRLIAQLACLEAAKENAEMKVGNAKGKSDREAMGTVLAQQKLLGVLEEHAKASDTKATLLKEENDSMTSKLESMSAELTDWKARAVSSEKKVQEATEINESIFKSEKEDTKGSAGAPMPPVMSVESATRRILNEEMEKYLSLERSSAVPVLARADNNSYIWQYQPRESSFGDYFDVANENELYSQSKPASLGKGPAPSSASNTTTARLRKYGRV